MLGNCFIDENPPLRSIWRKSAAIAEEVCMGTREVMEVVVEALTPFPEAYKALARLLGEREDAFHRARARERERRSMPDGARFRHDRLRFQPA